MKTRGGDMWARVDKSAGPDACWPWTTKSRTNGGYGLARVNGRVRLAHRAAWELTNGQIPEGMQVLHRCDNRPCCNPTHLFLGTQLDNIRDMWAKGRARPTAPRNPARCGPTNPARGLRNGRHTHPETVPRGDAHYARTSPERLARGSGHGCAKLDEVRVREIKVRLARGEKQTALAPAYGVTQSAISLIARGKKWAHVQATEVAS